jgi:hypothetical protein
MTLESQDQLDDIKTHACTQPDSDATFEWIEPPASAPRRPRTRWWRTGLVAACVLATLVALLVTQTHAGDAPSAPPERGAIALQTNVPWAQAVVDDDTQPEVISGDLSMPRELATRASPHVALGLTINIAPGRHVVALAAEGFTSRRATVNVVRNRAVRLHLPLAPTAAGRAGMLAAVNDLLSSMHADIDGAGDSPWLAVLGLRASTASLDVGLRFHAIALDPHEPFFVTSDAGGPAPAPGALGVAILASAQVSATDARTGQIIAQRTFLLGENDAVWASVWYDDGRWMAGDPYMRASSEPATPQILLAMLRLAGVNSASATQA